MNLKKLKDSLYSISVQNGLAWLVEPYTGQLVRQLGGSGVSSAAYHDPIAAIVYTDGSVKLFKSDGAALRNLSVRNVSAVDFSGNDILCNIRGGGSVLVSIDDRVIRIL